MKSFKCTLYIAKAYTNQCIKHYSCKFTLLKSFKCEDIVDWCNFVVVFVVDVVAVAVVVVGIYIDVCEDFDSVNLVLCLRFLSIFLLSVHFNF